jgi:hydroxyacyl-ACP dehydratase HTD2-like protein with hotdog domain
MDLSLAIAHAYPSAEWSLSGNDYDTLVWHGPGVKPTLVDLEAAWDARPQAPVVVSFRALAFALLEAELYPQVKAAALATPEGEIWWNTAQSTTVQRDHPFVISLATAIGQTPEQIDALFATAQTL